MQWKTLLDHVLITTDLADDQEIVEKKNRPKLGPIFGLLLHIKNFHQAPRIDEPAVRGQVVETFANETFLNSQNLVQIITARLELFLFDSVVHLAEGSLVHVLEGLDYSNVLDEILLGNWVQQPRLGQVQVHVKSDDGKGYQENHDIGKKPGLHIDVALVVARAKNLQQFDRLCNDVESWDLEVELEFSQCHVDWQTEEVEFLHEASEKWRTCLASIKGNLWCRLL